MYLNIAVKTSYLKVEKKLMIEIFENETISLMQNLMQILNNVASLRQNFVKIAPFVPVCIIMHNNAKL